MRSIFAAAALSGLLFSTALTAGPLPKNAQPMTSADIEALYSGKTAVWKVSSVYFAPNHQTRGVFNKKTSFSGTWNVKDNEICMVNTPQGAADPKTDCWKHWRSGKQTLALWSTHYDGSKVDDKNGYGPEAQNLKPGDLVAVNYVAVGGGKTIDGTTFKEKVVGHTLDWYSNKFKVGGQSRYNADGTAELKPPKAKDWVKGVWRVDGDQFCDKWGTDKEGCSGKITQLDDTTFFQANYLGIVGYK